MRYVMVALGVVFALTVTPALAQSNEQVVIEEVLNIYPGGAWSKCLQAPHSKLTVEAKAAGLRTPEQTRLHFAPQRQTARPDSYLAIPLDLEDIISTHTVEAGVYCYYISVSSKHPDMDPSRPERPFKSVFIRVTMTPMD